MVQGQLGLVISTAETCCICLDGGSVPSLLYHVSCQVLVTPVEISVSEGTCGEYSCDNCQGLAAAYIFHIPCWSEVGF